VCQNQQKIVKMDNAMPTSTKICQFFVDLVTIFLLVARAHITTQPFDNGGIVLIHDMIDDVKGLG